MRERLQRTLWWRYQGNFTSGANDHIAGGQVATAYPLRFSLVLARIAGGILVVAVAITVWDMLHGTPASWQHWLLLAAIGAGVALTLLPKSRWSLLLSCVSLGLSLTAVSSVIGAILHKRP